MGEILCPGCGIGTWSNVERDQHRAMGCYALADRRQRARETYYDTCAAGRDRVEGSAIALDAAIETATRVRITSDMIKAFGRAWHEADGAESVPNCTQHDMGDCPYHNTPGARLRAGLRAAFRVAGFEVEE